MKKFISSLLIVALAAMMLVGCGSSKGMTVTPGKLTMATNAYFPPYEYYEGSEIVGIDAEIAKAVADKLGLELVIEDMEFDSIITAVSQGKADMGLAGMTVTEDRLKNINFSDTSSIILYSILSIKNL